MGRRGYPPEFRRRVLALIDAGRKVRDVARDLGISEQTAYVRRKAAPDRPRTRAGSVQRRARRARSRPPANRPAGDRAQDRRRAAELLKEHLIRVNGGLALPGALVEVSAVAAVPS
jgi:transposase-like protein